MLTSLALIFLLGLIAGAIFNKIKLPSLIGMILVGILMSPYVFNLLDTKLLDIAADLRQIALVIILTRAGLSLDINALKKVGRPAILMCFVPACFEIVGVILIGTQLFGINIVDAAIMGSVIAAVSPAVIVPRMIKLMDEGYGVQNSIPQLILAGAAVDDIFVIVLFTAFTNLASGESFTLSSIFQVPIAIVLGIIGGVGIGYILVYLFKKWQMRDVVKVLVVLSTSFLLIELENQLEGIVPFSGLLAIMSMGIIMNRNDAALSSSLSKKYNALWIGAEVLLFVLVGATVNLNAAMQLGVVALVIVIGALGIRMIGVSICLIRTSLTFKERLFCMLAYTPKATVQAAIGGIPLAMGLACGQEVLTVAVLAILITAPFGAITMDYTYKKLLDLNK